MQAHIGLVLLTYQLGYFNILPLYVVLMIAAPFVAILYRAMPALVLPLSVGLYALTQVLGWNIPSWPVEGTWFFSPSAWQLIYVLGFLLAGKETDLGLFARKHIRVMRMIAVPVLVVGLAFASVRYFPNLFQLPATPYARLFDKTFLSVDRLLSVLAIIAVGGGLFAPIYRWLPACGRFLSMLGRTSLQVFCAGSLLSLCGQIIRFLYGGLVVTDVLLFIVGVGLMALVAWMVEWRTRIKMVVTRASAPAAPSVAAPIASSSPAS